MRWVVKTGSAILSKANGGLDPQRIEQLTEQLSLLHKQGHDVILVSSGAIAAGVAKLGMETRPQELRVKQSVAAIGQVFLMEAYERGFSKFGITPAQVLLTREDFVDRERYLNIRNTLLTLLSLKTIPIINENDTVSTEEIQFGDNDTLSAIVATKVNADRLVLLSDVLGVYETDSRGMLTTKVIPEIRSVTKEMEAQASKKAGSKMSVGGILAKFLAAKMATSAGIETWLAYGRDPDVLKKILENQPEAGTRFLGKEQKLQSRQAWIAFGRKSKGTLLIDEGAYEALKSSKKSLLPSGIIKVTGQFALGETVSVKTKKHGEVARGLVNFSSEDLKKVSGHHSSEINGILGRSAAGEVIHRDNLVHL